MLRAGLERAGGRRPEIARELLVTTTRRYYLMRPVETGEKHFLLMILDRRKADLAEAQSELEAIAAEL